MYNQTLLFVFLFHFSFLVPHSPNQRTSPSFNFFVISHLHCYYEHLRLKWLVSPVRFRTEHLLTRLTLGLEPHPYHRAEDKHSRVCHTSMHIHKYCPCTNL